MKAASPLIIGILFLLIGTAQASPADFDHSLFDQVLKKYVDDQGLVDYNGIAREPLFSEYLEKLKTARLESLSRDDQLAFWINAYNAVMIEKVIRMRPKKSVRETFFPGLWTSKKIFETRENTVANRSVSPDDIENEYLRKGFRDPRIHFAIICASMSCPPLPRVAYTEENVQARLEEETRKYLNSRRGIRIEAEENTLYVSRLFDWFEEDFFQKAGSVEDFLRPYLDESARAFLDRGPTISFLDYDWALNAKEPLQP